VVVLFHSQANYIPQPKCNLLNSSALIAVNTAILEDDELISYILALFKGVKNVYPEDHLQYCFMGGNVELSNDYSQMDKHIIHNFGKYWMVVATGVLKPFYEDQELFVKIVRGEEPAEYDVVKGWLKFMREYPEFVNGKVDV